MLCVKNANYKSNKKLSNLNIKNKNLKLKNNSKLMNSGIYVINKDFKKNLKKNIFSFKNKILKKLIKEKKVMGKKINNFNIDIGTKKNYRKFLSISKEL